VYVYFDMWAKTAKIVIAKIAPASPEMNHGDRRMSMTEIAVIFIRLWVTNQLKTKYAVVPMTKPMMAKIVKIFVLPANMSQSS